MIVFIALRKQDGTVIVALNDREKVQGVHDRYREARMGASGEPPLSFATEKLARAAIAILPPDEDRALWGIVPVEGEAAVKQRRTHRRR